VTSRSDTQCKERYFEASPIALLAESRGCKLSNVHDADTTIACRLGKCSLLIINSNTFIKKSGKRPSCCSFFVLLFDFALPSGFCGLDLFEVFPEQFTLKLVLPCELFCFKCFG
jgi:hypothetical protein